MLVIILLGLALCVVSIVGVVLINEKLERILDRCVAKKDTRQHPPKLTVIEGGAGRTSSKALRLVSSGIKGRV